MPILNLYYTYLEYNIPAINYYYLIKKYEIWFGIIIHNVQLDISKIGYTFSTSGWKY